MAINSSDQKKIDIINRFYLEISRKVFTNTEYEIVFKLQIEKRTKLSLAKEYNYSTQNISQIYINAFKKIRSVTELLGEIDNIKFKRNELRGKYFKEYKMLTKDLIPENDSVLDKKLINSYFPFSRRLWNMLQMMELNTLKDLTKIPLMDYTRYRGFKSVCKKEFIEFIEFETIEDFF